MKEIERGYSLQNKEGKAEEYPKEQKSAL